MTKFITNRDGKARIAELAREIEANGGTAPQNCRGFMTSTEAKSEISKMEAILADCRARKASAMPGSPALIQCLSEKLTDAAPPDIAARIANLDAATKRLQAITAQSKADAAKATAKAAAPANLLDQYSAMPPGPAKTAYLAANAVAIQQAAKDSNK